jgi:hypothetical protein
MKNAHQRGTPRVTKSKLNCKDNKVVVTAPLNMETAALSKAAQALNLPPEDERQLDLAYMTAIFVSSGTNKNGAVFLGSELIKARATIKDKAVDIEHDERSLIGQITNYAFLEQSGKSFDAEKASTKETAALDEMDMDIAISAIIHAARFPDIAEEIKRGEWAVSMEAYFTDYDIKVGEFIIPREQADEKGYQDMVGQVVKLKDGNKELGYHLIGRVLRGITFAGVGIVQNPANERSLILEAASLNNFIEEHKEGANTIDLSDFSTVEVASAEEDKIVAMSELSDLVKQIIQEELKVHKVGEQVETADSLFNHKRPGTCVSFKKEVVLLPGDGPGEPGTDLSQYPLYSNPGGPDTYPPGTRIVAENYCSLFDRECSARPGNATLPQCWRNVFARTVSDEITSHEQVLKMKRLEEGLTVLQDSMEAASKFLK